MKLYKYRDLSDPNTGFSVVEDILRTRSFWCARPDTLNDPEEFAWACDYTLSPYTEELLTRIIVQANGRTKEQAQIFVALALNGTGLKTLAEPVVKSLIHKCRDEIGLACFGSTADNDILWKRYAGNGAGVCIEVDVPDRLLGAQLHRVQYWDRKVVHIDTFLRSRFNVDVAAEFYQLSLMSKPKFWEPEAEMRFVSKRQNVSVIIEESAITCVVYGDALAPDIHSRVKELAPSIPMTNRNRKTMA